MAYGVLPYTVGECSFSRFLPRRQDASLHDGNDTFHGVGTVPAKPFRDDGHQSLHRKCHAVGTLLLWYAVTLQNRREHMAAHLVISAIQTQYGGVLRGCAEKAAVFSNVVQIRCQVLRR